MSCLSIINLFSIVGVATSIQVDVQKHQQESALVQGFQAGVQEHEFKNKLLPYWYKQAKYRSEQPIETQKVELSSVASDESGWVFSSEQAEEHIATDDDDMKQFRKLCNQWQEDAQRRWSDWNLVPDESTSSTSDNGLRDHDAGLLDQWVRTSEWLFPTSTDEPKPQAASFIQTESSEDSALENFKLFTQKWHKQAVARWEDHPAPEPITISKLDESNSPEDDSNESAWSFSSSSEDQMQPIAPAKPIFTKHAPVNKHQQPTKKPAFVQIIDPDTLEFMNLLTRMSQRRAASFNQPPQAVESQEEVDDDASSMSEWVFSSQASSQDTPVAATIQKHQPVPASAFVQTANMQDFIGLTQKWHKQSVQRNAKQFKIAPTDFDAPAWSFSTSSQEKSVSVDSTRAIKRKGLQHDDDRKKLRIC